jgi:serine phosphatase RsbU (regulator of sigma subunit)
VNLPQIAQIDYVYGALAVAVLSLILTLWAMRGITVQRRRLARLLQGSRDTLEEALVEAQAAARAAEQRVQHLEQRVAELEDEIQHAITRVGMVRFNPFADTGADLSFAVALMNRKDNGVILTGLWGREEVRVYAKQIQAGQSAHALSQEEKQALDLARRQRPR